MARSGRSRRSSRHRALVLGCTKLAEQDLIVTMLNDKGTQLRAVAKGARKPGGRFAARLDLFCEVDVLIAEGASLGLVTDAALISAHPQLRTSYEKSCAASAVADVAHVCSYEDAEDPYVFGLLSRTLTALEQAPTRALIDTCVAAYIFKVCGHLGWLPEFDSCIACGDAQVERFSVMAGGALCASCAHEQPGAELFEETSFARLKTLMYTPFDTIEQLDVSQAEALELLALAHRWAAVHLDARLRSLEFMLSA